MAVSTSTSFFSEFVGYDDYDADHDVVAPLPLRTTVMQLVWVCGDCGEHYPRHVGGSPRRCDACGAPREHFFSPTED